MMKNAKSQFLAIVLAVILAIVCGGLGSIGTLMLIKEGIISLEFLGITQEEGTSAGSGGEQSLVINVGEDPTIAEAIAAKVLPSVVGISTISTQQYQNSIFGWGWGDYFSYDSESIGTGVIVDEAGYILTNSHVVNDGNTKSISVSLFDGTVIEGRVLWNDATVDLAVVKIDAKGLQSADLGDSDELKIGSYTAAIGNPLGLEFERSMSQGIISGLNRSISVSSGSGSQPLTMEGLLQTDATINGGNSGGPLLNIKGEVIGINTAKAQDGEGMGFAIPINEAKPIVEQIKETGTFDRPYIGISGLSLDEQTRYTAEELVEYFGTARGIYVQSITPGGGAQAAGIEPGDIIVEVEGTPVATMNRINSLLLRYRIGDEVSVTVMRKGEEVQFSVTLTGYNPSL